MNYTEALQYLDTFANYERISPQATEDLWRLERVQWLLDQLGNPHQKFPSIHIAGTKGKGSTAAMIASILKTAGYRTGMYTSPHLFDVKERIQISGIPISEQRLIQLVETIKPVAERYRQNDQWGPLTWFEVFTAIAFLFFAGEAIDMAVLETGLGGRLDATNVVTPKVCVITSISYDHTAILGSDLASIAKEKAGIIKEKVPVVVSPQMPQVMEVLAQVAKEKNAPLYEVGKDIRLEGKIERDRLASGRSHGQHRKQSFSAIGRLGHYEKLSLSLLGDYQVTNALTAIGVAESLQEDKTLLRGEGGVRGEWLGEGAISEGLGRTQWPGRLQVLRERPLVVVDGAQNKASAAALAQAMPEWFQYDRLLLVIGISNDKDQQGILSELSRIAHRIIVTRADHPRATSIDRLAKMVDSKKLAGKFSHIDEALHKAQKMVSTGDLILVTGSLFVVGEAILAMQKPFTSAQEKARKLLGFMR